MPRAQSADGVIHDFPDGTDPGVIDRVMKSYATEHAPASALSGYLRGSLEGVKEAGRDIAAGAKDIGLGLLPGQDPRPGFERMKEIGMFASGGLTSPIGPQKSGPLARADRPPAPKSVSVSEFLKKADEAAPGGEKAAAEKSGMSVGEMAHLLHAVLTHNPAAIARILGKKFLHHLDGNS